MIRVQLLIGGKKYEATDDLVNWEDVKTSIRRKDFGGVYRTFGDSFEFAGNSYLLLEHEFLTNYLNASAVIVIGVLNNSWTYNEKMRCTLDFSSYENNGNTISIKAVDNSAEAIINANKSQVYDIPVSSLKSSELYYDRMELNNKCDFYVVPTEEQTEEGIYKISMPAKFIMEAYNFPVSYGTVNFPVKNKIDVGDVAITSTGNANYYTGYMIKGLTRTSVKYRMSFDVYATIKGGDTNKLRLMVEKYERVKDGEKPIPTVIDTISIPFGSKVSIDKTYDIDLKEGDRIIMWVEQGDDVSLWKGDVLLTVSNVKELSVSYIGRNEPVNIDVFTPNDLLTSLLSNMGLTDISGFVEEGAIAIPFMMAAESVRGITNAKVHTSFSKFAEWAKACLGYYYKIEGNKVVFRHFTKMYDPETIKELDFVNSLDVSINTALIYSGVEVGYEKKDYDEINGRDEFHVKNSFSTGVNINDNIYKLVSPYRADCYGIEFLSQKREEETKDDTSDNDLFIVDAILVLDPATSSLVLKLNRQGYRPSGVLFPYSVFNVAYSPRRMLLANKEYLSACTKRLDFTASEGNADAVLLEESEKSSVLIDSHFFRVETVKVETIGLSPFPPSYEGLISFRYNNRLYSGYVSDITEYIGKVQSTEYTLICKGIE